MWMFTLCKMRNREIEGRKSKREEFKKNNKTGFSLAGSTHDCRLFR